MATFRVIDLRGDEIASEQVVDGAASPEDAARQALGFDVVRSGASADLVARVYWQPLGGPLSMVRLYRKAERPGSEAMSKGKFRWS